MCISPWMDKPFRNILKNMKYMQGYANGAEAAFKRKVKSNRQCDCGC